MSITGRININTPSMVEVAKEEPISTVLLPHIISHRGNTEGRVEADENHPALIQDLLARGFSVEVDVWAVEHKSGMNLYLGHDEPKWLIHEGFLSHIYSSTRKTEGRVPSNSLVSDARGDTTRLPHIWAHCKNIEAQIFLKDLDYLYGNFHYFAHDKDDYAFTSRGYIWTCNPSFRNKKLNMVLMDATNEYISNITSLDELSGISWVCTDDIRPMVKLIEMNNRPSQKRG